MTEALTNRRTKILPESPRLRILGGREAGREIPLAGTLILGRAEDCDLRIIDESASRRHAEVRIAEGRVEVRDLGSANGTLVNGLPVSPAPLADGDVIRIGAIDILFLGVPESARLTRIARAALPALTVMARVPGRAAVEIVGKDPAFLAALERARRAAKAEAPVLVTGESGTGKELVARLVHDSSARAAGPFIAVNSAAIPEALIENELFGHESGAFTGAGKRKIGYFEAADKGTLFLDEIGDLSAGAQAKLLRAIETGDFYRVGGTAPVHASVRIVAATHRDLEKAVAEERFREDLFHRLNILCITLPRLSARKKDIPLLAEHFLRRVAARMKQGARSFSPEALAALSRRAWPGNVRELANIVESVAVMTQGSVIRAEDLPTAAPRPVAVGAAGPGSMVAAERRAIIEALSSTGGKKGAAAQLLGISWPTLNKKIAEYGIRDEELRV